MVGQAEYQTRKVHNATILRIQKTREVLLQMYKGSSLFNVTYIEVIKVSIDWQCSNLTHCVFLKVVFHTLIANKKYKLVLE